jgi:sortase A
VTEAPAEASTPAPADAVKKRKQRKAKQKSKANRPPRKPGEGREVTGATVVAFGLMILTGLLALFGAYLFVGSGLAADRTQDVMYQDIEKNLGLATVPVAGVIPDGTPLGIVELPRLGVEQVFVEGSASEETVTGPGLKPDSVLPGQTGLSVLVGRRAAFGAPFRELDQMRPGDRILVTTGQGKFTYIVDLVRVSDAPATEIESVPSRLTLVTSDPAITPSRSLQVSAQLDGKALPRSTGTVATADDAPGAGSSGRGTALLLWAQLLLLVTGLVTWAGLKYNARAVWIGAVPVLLAILWNVFENLAVLLPNTL